MIELSGEGEIYAGDRLLRRTRYRLSLGEGEPANIEGTIELANEAEANLLARVERLTLLLDDGRHLAFSLASPHGRILAQGGLEGIETSRR